jgi:hypothetical protein
VTHRRRQTHYRWRSRSMTTTKDFVQENADDRFGPVAVRCPRGGRSRKQAIAIALKEAGASKYESKSENRKNPRSIRSASSAST